MAQALVIGPQGCSRTSQSSKSNSEGIHAPAGKDDGERWVALGDLGIRLQEPGLAATFFRNAIAVQPDFVPAYLGLAVTEATRGLLPEAREHVQEALRRDPGSERARQLQHMLPMEGP